MSVRANGLLAAALALLSCAAPERSRPVRPAPLLHLVYVQLAEGGETQALLDDCHSLLATIPSVVAFAAGRHLDTGRGAGVAQDYDLALLLGFDDVAGYEAYLVHPNHLELLRRWQPRVARLTIHDVADEPARR